MAFFMPWTFGLKVHNIFSCTLCYLGNQRNINLLLWINKTLFIITSVVCAMQQSLLNCVAACILLWQSTCFVAVSLPHCPLPHGAIFLQQFLHSCFNLRADHFRRQRLHKIDISKLHAGLRGEIVRLVVHNSSVLFLLLNDIWTGMKKCRKSREIDPVSYNP